MGAVSPILGLGIGVYILKVVLHIFTKWNIGWLGIIAWTFIFIGIAHSLWLAIQGE